PRRASAARDAPRSSCHLLRESQWRPTSSLAWTLSRDSPGPEPEPACAAFLEAAARLSSAPVTRRRARGRCWGVGLTALAAAAGCAKQPFPPGWVYVTRLDRTAATVVWTGPGTRVVCRGSDGSGADASGTVQDRDLRAARLDTLRPDTGYACRIVDAAGRGVTPVPFRTHPVPRASVLIDTVEER